MKGFLAMALVGVPVSSASGPPSIEHAPVACIVAERFPRLDACFAATEVARARIMFRPGGGEHWYFVDMVPAEGCHRGILPKPKRELRRIDYYVEVTDRAFATGRTPEYDPVVIAPEDSCRDRPAALFLDSEQRVLVRGEPGAPPIPQGFDAAGVSVASLDASPASKRRSPALLIVGGVGAAVAGVAVAAGGGSTASPTPTTSAPSSAPSTTLPAPTPSPTPSPTPTPPPDSTVTMTFNLQFSRSGKQSDNRNVAVGRGVLRAQYQFITGQSARVQLAIETLGNVDLDEVNGTQGTITASADVQAGTYNVETGVRDWAGVTSAQGRLIVTFQRP